MRTGSVVAAAFATMAAIAAAHAQQAPQGPQQAPAASFEPGVGDLMHLLVQPRHAKLGLAGEAKNWPLAAYALKELQQALATVSKVRPKWRNLTVEEMIQSVTTQPLKELTDAIQAQNAKEFARAYGELTDGCNACHAAANLSFIVIKPPEPTEAVAFPNQDFGAK